MAYKLLKSKKVNALIMGSAMLLGGILPGMSAFAQSANVTLTGSSLTSTPGGQVSFTASAPGVSNPEYQFWVEEPNGQWQQETGYTSNPTYVLTTPTSGDYLVSVNVLSKSQLQSGDWSAAIRPLSDGVFVGSTVTTSVSSATVVQGQSVTITASSTNIYNPQYQFWYETPSGQWVQDNYGYSSANTYTFTANQTGTYKFVAYGKSPLAVNSPEGAIMSEPVGSVTSVVGQPSLSALTVTGQTTGTGAPSSPATAMNGASLTFGTTLEGPTGNPLVGTSVTFAISQSNALPSPLPSVTTNGTNVSGSANSNNTAEDYSLYTNANGQANITVAGPPNATVGYTVTAAAPFSVNGQALMTSPVTAEFVTSGSIGIAPYTTSSKPFDALLTSPVVPVTVTLPPVNGSAQTNVPINVSVAAGTGFLSSAAGSDLGSTQTVYTNSAGQATVYVDSASAGETTFAVTSTASSPTLNQDVYIDWSQPGIPTQIVNFAPSVATPTAGQNTTLSGTVEDASGNPVAGTKVLVAAENSTGVANDSGNDSYMSNGSSVAFPEVTASSLSGVTANANYGDVVTTDSNGNFSLTVTNSSATGDTYYAYAVQNGVVSGAVASSTKVTWGPETTLNAVGAFGTYAGASTASAPVSSVTGIQVGDGGTGTGYFAPFTSTGALDDTTVTYDLSASNGGKISTLAVGSGTAHTLSNPVSSLQVTMTYDASTKAYTLSYPGESSKTSLAGSTPIVAAGVTNSTTGNTQLTASATGAKSASVTFDFVAGSPAYVTNFPLSTVLNSGAHETVSYTVVDANGNPVDNAPSTIAWDPSTTHGLWITAVNGQTLQTTVSGTVVPTPIPLSATTKAGYSVSQANVASWSGTGTDNALVYSNSSGVVTLTLQAAPITIESGTTSSTTTVGTTTTSAEVYAWTGPKATSTAVSTYGQVYVNNSASTGPASGYNNIGSISW